MKIFGWLAFLGAMVAASATTGCILCYVDEPTMPESLIK